MMIERLEEIKEHFRWTLNNSLVPRLHDSEIEWLIQQAERAQKNAQDLEDMDRQLYSEQQQNKRYREALEEIARDRFPGASYKARKALEGEK